MIRRSMSRAVRQTPANRPRLHSVAAVRQIALRVLFCASLLSVDTWSVAAEDDEDEAQLLPGLVARYAVAGVECVRRDDAVNFVWNDRSPDERLPEGDFSARWEGQLLVLSPGKHRFYV
ncbi:MAG TPA: hypothetical protein VGX78_04340 [Pirellulales bacterium]|nr:hypothetical protein [Pirellulales bacterium]